MPALPTIKMKYLAYILFLLTINSVNAQTHKEKFRELEPDVWLGIWDIENSEHSFKIDSISYDEIPKYLDFRGTVVEAIKWTDSIGENILIQSVTGQFNWKDYLQDSSEYMLQDKSELYAYLFQKKKGEKTFSRLWKIYDYGECFGVDWFTGFIPRATTITDIDKDGVSEISLPYVLICRGGMDPGIMKIIMYEGQTKYALRGSTMIFCKGEHTYGGEYKASENLKGNKIFNDFLIKRWDFHKCENERFY
tara:strand:- start:293 stop:1042 length:750 start_codon:yes stop_codon:yes gene_type:complete